MIKFDRFTLSNGLKVIIHKDQTTPFVAVNVLYDVGAKDEDSERTGFAHLFEHLMFGGSVNIPDYDQPLQQAGGENNAFTNNDFTNYYITVPKQNLETAFWLESDRMLSLAFSQKSLTTQKQVVIEEFKQRYLNQPYGDVSLLMRPLAYKKHPYQWSTIGKEISHIEKATLADVKEFFFQHYAPNNASLTVVGNVETNEIKALAEKWFGDIEKRTIKPRKLPKEPKQKEERHLTVKKDVPYTGIYKSYHMCSRTHKDYQTCDLLSDILSNGKSSRLYQRLVKEQNLFSEIDASIEGCTDEGLFYITGKLFEGVAVEIAEKAIETELDKIKKEPISDYELNKVKNKIESSLVFSEIEPLNKAMNLAYFELIGDANLINSEVDKYRSITAEQMQTVARNLFTSSNCSTLYYLSEK